MNNQIKCEIIQDLMPLVLDNACSDGSRKAVEEHIAGCSGCAEVYAAMKSETPKPAGDANEKKHFARTMRKIRRKTWLMIGAFCLAAVLLTVGIITYFFPDYDRGCLVPASWFHDAQILRTEEGELIFKFTPDERYKDYLGDQGWGLRYGQDKSDPDAVALELAFGYSSAAKLLNREVPFGIPQNYDFPFMELGNDWIISLSATHQLYYEDGRIVHRSYRPVTMTELKAIQEGTFDKPVYNEPDGARLVVRQDNDPYYEPIPVEHLQVGISDNAESGRTDLIFHKTGEEIPLCSREIAEEYAIQKYYTENWGYSEYNPQDDE